jgi:phage terminase large subunit-like protein
VLILDEWQLMKETAWDEVGAPMLLDNDGDAVFVYTPPSLRTTYRSRARDPRHAAKMFKRAQQDTTGRWACFHFTSFDNPFISRTALNEISQDMTPMAFRQEIKAEDIDDDPSALWKRHQIDHVLKAPDLARCVVGVDPSGSKGGDAIGIITCGFATIDEQKHFYVLADNTLHGTPDEWGRAVVAAYHRHSAGLVVAEVNFGGEMVEHTIKTIDPSVPVKMVYASRGKAVRAEPVSVIYAQGRGHHVGSFPALEDELCQWVPGSGKSPNRLDAAVWGATELVIGSKPPPAGGPVQGVKLHERKRRPSRWRR